MSQQDVNRKILAVLQALAEDPAMLVGVSLRVDAVRKAIEAEEVHAQIPSVFANPMEASTISEGKKMIWIEEDRVRELHAALRTARMVMEQHPCSPTYCAAVRGAIAEAKKALGE